MHEFRSPGCTANLQQMAEALILLTQPHQAATTAAKSKAWQFHQLLTSSFVTGSSMAHIPRGPSFLVVSTPGTDAPSCVLAMVRKWLHGEQAYRPHRMYGCPRWQRCQAMLAHALQQNRSKRCLALCQMLEVAALNVDAVQMLHSQCHLRHKKDEAIKK